MTFTGNFKKTIIFSFIPLGLSVLAHLVFVISIALLSNRMEKLTASRTSPPQWTMIEVEPPSKTVQKKDEQKKAQIVQTSKGEKTETAKKAAFLGEQTQQVKEQTVSKSQVFAGGENLPKPKPKSQPQSKAKAEKSTKQASIEQSSLLSKFGLQMLPQEQSPQEEPRWAPQSGGVPQDYVKGIRESDRTALNTKEFVFYGYYQRIREQLDRAWVPLLRERLGRYYQAGRRLASDMDHTTRIMVTLNTRGEVTKVQVVSESGTQDLDDTAINAFNLAGPFPNPPKGIIDSNNEIQIPWEFVLRT